MESRYAESNNAFLTFDHRLHLSTMLGSNNKSFLHFNLKITIRAFEEENTRETIETASTDLIHLVLLEICFDMFITIWEKSVRSLRCKHGDSFFIYLMVSMAVMYCD